jgi:hypothetical protein
MKSDGFSYVVRAELLFTEEEIDIMSRLALDHYDFTCRLAAKPRTTDDIRSTNGMLVIMKWKYEDKEIAPTPSTFGSGPLNLLMKILEGRAFIRNDDELFDKAEKLFMDIKETFHQLQARMQELNYPKEKT